MSDDSHCPIKYKQIKHYSDTTSKYFKYFKGPWPSIRMWMKKQVDMQYSTWRLFIVKERSRADSRLNKPMSLPPLDTGEQREEAQPQHWLMIHQFVQLRLIMMNIITHLSQEQSHYRQMVYICIHSWKPYELDQRWWWIMTRQLNEALNKTVISLII